MLKKYIKITLNNIIPKKGYTFKYLFLKIQVLASLKYYFFIIATSCTITRTLPLHIKFIKISNLSNFNVFKY